MLVGRGAERRTIGSLLAAARLGRSAVLVLSGEAGVGKTALLEHAGAAAGDMQVLRATGTESESELPFGGLLQLLRPALVHLDRIPAPQAAALESALALRPGTGEDRYAVGAGTLSLLSRFAEDRPLAVLIDDAHLLDLASAQALVFAARRLTADQIAVLATVRSGRPGPWDEAHLPVLAVGGLSVTETGDLLVASGHRLEATAVARLHDLTGGNPLAVVELAVETAWLEPPASGSPVPVPASLVRAFARRLDQLTAEQRTAALVAAAAGTDLDVIAGACRLLEVDVRALGAAEDLGLLHVGAGAVAFRHALVRSAVYSAAAPTLRRAVHRALAAALPRDAERRAWHRAEAAVAPDEEVARALLAVADEAGRRSAHAVASGAYERAARLSPEREDRAGRLAAAGASAWQAGLGDRATALLTQAADLVPPPGVRAAIAAVRGGIAIRTGSLEDARDLLLEAGTAADDPDTAVLLLADAILACFFLGDMTTVRTAADRIDALAARLATGPARLVGALATGAAAVLVGGDGPPTIRRAVRGLDPASPLLADPRVALWLVIGPLFLREAGTGRDLVRVVVEGVRRRTAVADLPILLFYVGRDEATTDRWDLAAGSYAEGVLLAREVGQSTDLAACLAGLAWLEARQGEESACREHAAEALRVCSERRIGLFRCWSVYALGELELGLGRPGPALAHFAELDALLTGSGLADVDLSPAPEVVDALTVLGRHDEARAVAVDFASRARAKGQPWALARAARALALTGPDEEVDRCIDAALRQHGRTLDAFELARTQLVHGARLRRARRRADARPPLRAALAAFERLGALPWADRAAGELRATGETVSPRGASLLAGLTSQELQVARLLAAGRTTREAAAALFLSPKTVEYHLRHVYVKLGVGTRAELAVRLAAEQREAGD